MLTLLRRSYCLQMPPRKSYAWHWKAACWKNGSWDKTSWGIVGKNGIPWGFFKDFQRSWNASPPSQASMYCPVPRGLVTMLFSPLSWLDQKLEQMIIDLSVDSMLFLIASSLHTCHDLAKWLSHYFILLSFSFLFFSFLIWTYYIRKKCRKVSHDNVACHSHMSGYHNVTSHDKCGKSSAQTSSSCISSI